MDNTTNFRTMNGCIDQWRTGLCAFEHDFERMYDNCTENVHTYAVLFRNGLEISDFLAELNASCWTTGRWWQIENLQEAYRMLEFKNGSKIHLVSTSGDICYRKLKGTTLDDILVSPTLDPTSEFVKYIQSLIRCRYHYGDTQVTDLDADDVDITSLFG